MYFTILHWITFIILLILFILFCVLALRQSNKKLIYSMLFSNFLVISMLGVFSVFVLDKYTKQARLEDMNQKRILITESLTLSGKIRNIGSFKIGTCSLEVKLVSNAISSSTLSGSNVFNPRSGLGSLFTNEKEAKPTTVIQEFTIAKNLEKGELRNFSISMRYPPYFQKTFMSYKLYCH